ncbi:MAG: methyltransferase domain-containing protein [Candidatus Sericytochromatia bacterium]|nr:methyltransferase domain-containing protein [Candidatus Sericytochromatia bacterium]
MLLFNSPLSQAKAQTLIGLLDLPDQAQVLDIGCGNGEFLLQVLEHYPKALGRGVELNPALVAEAKLRMQGRVDPERLRFHQGDARVGLPAMPSLDLLICLGASQAFAAAESAYPALLAACLERLRPAGLALIGEAFWQQSPTPEYLALLGEPAGIYRSQLENVTLAQARGFNPLYITDSNPDEWDDFEWRHQMRLERALGQAPENAEILEKVQHGRRWRDGYLRWGRSTLGFGFYLLQKS